MVPVRLVLDWDGTLTKHDTLHLVAAIGYDRNRDANLTPWDDIVQAYISDYSQYAKNYRPVTKDRKTIAEESTWLASLKDVEERSVKRAFDAGIFNGVTVEDICAASESAIQDRKVQLRHGWKKLLDVAAESESCTPTTARVSILSVNWSGTFIRDCLRAAIANSSNVEDAVDSIPIFANEIHKPVPSIRTSADKLEAFGKIRDDESKIVYVGDSPGDFDCLIAADVGICVRDEPMGSGQKELMETLERVGITVSRLSDEAWETELDRVKDKRFGKGQERKKTVWWVNDLLEAVKFIEDRGLV